LGCKTAVEPSFGRKRLSGLAARISWCRFAFVGNFRQANHVLVADLWAKHLEDDNNFNKTNNKITSTQICIANSEYLYLPKHDFGVCYEVLLALVNYNWGIMNISRLNYRQTLPFIHSTIQKADFVALDLEMSGIQTE
jgi:hypothetical protein